MTEPRERGVMKMRPCVISAVLGGLLVTIPPSFSGSDRRNQYPGFFDRRPPVATGTSIQMNRIAVLSSPASGEILSTPGGFDLDHDGLRELILRVGTTLLAFYESPTDDTFALVHVLNPQSLGYDGSILGDAGDIDEDGRSDLVVLAFDHMGADPPVYSTQIYESAFTYPTQLVWEMPYGPSGWSLGGLIGDTDLDGKLEIVVQEPAQGGKLVIYEAAGDNMYVQSYSLEPIPTGFTSSQSIQLLNDVDEDGRDEILIGGAGGDFKIVAIESTGDDTYEHIWTWIFNPPVNVRFIVDAGDLDGDSRKEFLAGGLASGSMSRMHVFESVADNEVEIVATFTQPASNDFYTSANVADVDGDGRREIVFATGSVVKILENTGDNAWQEIWSGAGGSIQDIGAGDHDQDGKDEVIFRTGSLTNGATSVWEIDPLDQADMDGDDRVDAIDNCPLDFNPGQEDADADTVGDACDNCLHGPNPDQGPAPLGQTIVAADAETFSWPVAADVIYVRGALAGVSTYAIDLVDALSLAQGLADTTLPESGAGFWYLLRPDCPVGSWQSTLGAEPARDVSLP